MWCLFKKHFFYFSNMGDMRKVLETMVLKAAVTQYYQYRLKKIIMRK